jgi:hypothetical protein
MKGLSALFLLLVISFPVSAVEDGQIMYVGGTVTILKEGILGRLDTTSQSALTFDASGTRLAIPYAMIDSFEYSKRVAHHLGVLPAIALGLVKQRQHKHFIRISYHEENNSKQVAIFEVPKDMPRMLLPILQARAPQGCKSQAYAKCGVQPS